MFLPRDADLARAFAGRGAGADSIEVGMLDEAAARGIMADLERQDEERKAEEAEEENSLKAPGQVVDLPTPREQKRPDDARFVSEHDSSVERETKKYGRFEDNARQGRLRGHGVGAASGPAGRRWTAGDAHRLISAASCATPGRRDRRRAPGARGQRVRRAPPGHLEQGGVIPELGVGRAASSGRRRREGRHRAFADARSEEQLARAIGGGTQDALRDIDDGDETALNSKRWRFASFFNRVKRQVAEHWHPDEVYRQRDPTGSVYGRRNRYTELRIQLKPDGRLSNVALAQPSGLEFLDDEAVEAFKQAEPFPNPPRQLIENGTISFGFGFLFDLNGPPQMRWFRYNY